MKRTTIFMLLLMSIVSVSVAWAQSKSQTWEYKFVYQCDEKKTNTLAAEGWDLADMSVASYGSMGAVTCVFKRTK